jgi:hypothetical protein
VVAQLFMSHPGPLADLPEPTLPAGFSFRPAVSDDADELAELVTAAYDPEHDIPWDGARMRTELLDASDDRGDGERSAWSALFRDSLMAGPRPATSQG